MRNSPTTPGRVRSPASRSRLAAGTRKRTPVLGCKHNDVVLAPGSAAAAPLTASHRDSAGPPATSIFFSFPPAKNAMKRLSGDQKGRVRRPFRAADGRPANPGRAPRARFVVHGGQEGQAAPIRRHGREAVRVERRFFRRQHGDFENAGFFGGTSDATQRSRQCQRGDRCGRRDGPGKLRRRCERDSASTRASRRRWRSRCAPRRYREADSSRRGPGTAAAVVGSLTACLAGSLEKSTSARNTSASVCEIVSPSNRPPSQHLPQHDAERPDVGALVDRLARCACSGVMYAAVPMIIPATRGGHRQRRRVRPD